MNTRTGKTRCINGRLPHRCKRCCDSITCDGGPCDPDYKPVSEICDPICMEDSLACKNWCETEDDGSTACIEGYLPPVCADCCNDCPEMKICTSQCTLEKMETMIHLCIEQLKTEITNTCIETCTAKATSPDDCDELLNCQTECCTSYDIQTQINACYQKKLINFSPLECIEYCEEV